MLHHYDWLSRRKRTCDWLSYRKSTCQMSYRLLEFDSINCVWHCPANVNINYRLPIIIYYRICTVRHIGIEIIHGSQNVLKGLTWVGRILVNFICQPMLKLKTHSGFHDLFLKFYTCKVSCQIISISLISSLTDCNLSLPQCNSDKKDKLDVYQIRHLDEGTEE